MKGTSHSALTDTDTQSLDEVNAEQAYSPKGGDVSKCAGGLCPLRLLLSLSHPPWLVVQCVVYLTNHHNLGFYTGISNFGWFYQNARGLQQFPEPCVLEKS